VVIKKDKRFLFVAAEEKPVLKIIETFLHNPIHVIEIDKKDRAATIDFAKDNVVKEDLNALLREVEELELKKKKETEEVVFYFTTKETKDNKNYGK
jgi:hypothetical protein